MGLLILGFFLPQRAQRAQSKITEGLIHGIIDIGIFFTAEGAEGAE
jgi:hypothetical protein